MSSYVFMKVLESTAHRYDRGMRLLSRGRIGGVYARVADLVAAPGGRVLDIGCGTGAVALACAARGADVTGIDVNAEMLEVARSKTLPIETSGSVEWLQLSAAEIEDRFAPESFDAVTACLVLSELSPDERAYTLAIALSRLRPGGRAVLADEVEPDSAARRVLHRVGRLPLEVLTYLLTQTTTHAVSGLADQVRAAGFVEVDEERPWPAFAIVGGSRPLEAA
jgi:demethylmenaquinone methyltransferase/2-methoxy-6-polyprenyl-1,4-benzoquinol methylase